MEQAILGLANGFLKHKDNDDLRQRVAEARLSAEDFYKEVLRVIYRLLFLMVIEERGLVEPLAEGPRGIVHEQVLAEGAVVDDAVR